MDIYKKLLIALMVIGQCMAVDAAEQPSADQLLGLQRTNIPVTDKQVTDEQVMDKQVTVKRVKKRLKRKPLTDEQVTDTQVTDTQAMDKQAMDKQVTDKEMTDNEAQVLQQQQILQEQVANLIKQGYAIEERSKELSRIMIEHEKRLEAQKNALATLEQQLTEEKKAYAEQVKRYDDLKAQLEIGMAK